MTHQPVYDIAAICAKHGIKQSVICPGSRSAPVLLGFTRHPEIECFTFSDERSAAFFALGMAQSSGNTIALVCTSGSAAYNFAPAVAEAHYSQVPLLVITADRPVEWIDQYDGQTIKQRNIYGDHVKSAFNFPGDFSHADVVWHAQRMVNEAIILANTFPKGPVHINVPLREPLYSQEPKEITFSTNLHFFRANTLHTTISKEEFDSLSTEWGQYQNKLLIVGQMQSNPELTVAIKNFSEQHNIPVVADIISNQHGIPEVITYQDLFLGHSNDEKLKSLRPDLLISIGQSLISKSLKMFLRKNKAKAHWHIQTPGSYADTFQQLSRIIYSDPAVALNRITSIESPEAFNKQKQNNYYKLWQIAQRSVARSMNSFFPLNELSEIELVHEVLKEVPDGSNIHLANSTAVRYANFLGLPAEKANVNVWSNRGTSGIDGCTSTAAGHAINNESLQVLISGDMAFFYDRNAFWHNYTLNNLRIILLNNHGSLIFGLLEGPSALPEFEEFFETRQALNAKSLAAEFGIEYLKLDNKRKLKNLLKDFFDADGGCKILELETSTKTNKQIIEALKSKIKQNYES